jgi:catechol 2,3-dioxygenase-like lactoylglutathione lyase family enzyme
MSARTAPSVEHANLTVRDVDEAIRFLRTALPEFRVRGEGKNFTMTAEGETWARRWAHVGDDHTYVALAEAPPSAPGLEHSYARVGINHVGFAVASAERVAARLREAGYREGFLAEPHPHRRRVYFHDADDIEWEFVEYFSDDPAERNDYAS